MSIPLSPPRLNLPPNIGKISAFFLARRQKWYSPACSYTRDVAATLQSAPVFRDAITPRLE